MRQTNLFFIVITFLTSQINVQTQAQTPDSITLNDIVIKENRIQVPFSEVSRNIEIITRQQINNAPARSLADLLGYVSGVDVRQRGVGNVQADINIRGGTFDQTLVLLDGFPLADPQSGHHLLNLPIDIQNIERIEILKGTGARVYGLNAFAGVVNIVSRKLNHTVTPKHDEGNGIKGGAKVGVVAGVNYGELGTIGMKAGVKLDNSLFPTRLFYSRNTSEGYRKNTDYSIQNYFLQSQATVFKQKIDLMGGFTDRKFGGSGFYAGPSTNRFAALPVDNFTDEYETIKTSFASASTTFKGEDWRITPRLYWRKHADDYYFVRGSSIFNSTTSNILGADWNLSYDNKLGTFGLGAMLQRTGFKSLKLDTTTRTQVSAFIEQRFKLLNNRLDITPGLMYTIITDLDAGLFPGIDVGYRVSETVKLYSSWGRTFRIPTFTDLYFSNASNASNANLQPEYAQNFEIGAKFNQNGFRITAAWFMRDGRDIIDRVKTDTTPGVKWFPTNLASLKVEGYDVSLNYLPTILRGGDFWLQRVSLSATYLSKVAYNKGSEVKASRYAADQLKWQANVGLQTKIVGRLSQSINVRYFERIVLPKGYEDFYKGFLTDWRLTWTDKYFTIIAQANNIFNKKYVETNGITMPRRWLSIGLETQFE